MNATAPSASVAGQPSDTRPPLVALTGISKAFGRTRALAEASFDIRPGEVHALLGENGSGKSTLVKILSGVHLPDTGSLALAGTPTPFFTAPRDAQRAGIVTVFQEVLCLEARTVLENLWVGNERPGHRVPLRERRARAQAVLAKLLPDPPALDRLAETLTLSERQTIAIARALLREPRVLILDEATSALDFDTRNRLFAEVRALGAKGVGCVLITHKMDEIEEIGDRVTVLRSGDWIGTLDRGDWDETKLVRMMTGNDHLVERKARATGHSPGPTRIEVRDLRLTPRARPVDLDIHAGEILGVAGLEGHGQEALLQTLAGAGPATQKGPGRVIFVSPEGSRTDIRRPSDAARAGIAYVPRDRRGEAIFDWMSIAENFAVPTLNKDAPGGWLRPGKSAARLADYIKSMSIRLGGPTDAITTLSGGNQQKVVIARWLAAAPSVLILNDPTRGIDINAKRDLYALLRDLASDGLAIVMLSSEVDEHIELMDRVIVMREHGLSSDVTRPHIDREPLVASFFGHGELPDRG